jgi:hypothetical protein
MTGCYSDPPQVLIDYHLSSSFFDYDPIALPLLRGLPFCP